MYEQSVDRLACALDGKVVLPPAFQVSLFLCDGFGVRLGCIFGRAVGVRRRRVVDALGFGSQRVLVFLSRRLRFDASTPSHSLTAHRLHCPRVPSPLHSLRALPILRFFVSPAPPSPSFRLDVPFLLAFLDDLPLVSIEFMR